MQVDPTYLAPIKTRPRLTNDLIFPGRLGGKNGGRMKHVTGSIAGNGFLRELLEQIEDLAEKYLGGSAVPNSLKWREPIIGIVRGIVRRCCYTNH
jgi:hypothetical protein